MKTAVALDGLLANLGFLVETKHWSEALPDPITKMIAVSWMSVIEESSVQMMYAEQATRYFLQVVQRVNTLDSHVFSPMQ